MQSTISEVVSGEAAIDFAAKSLVISDEEAIELWHHIAHQFVDYKYTHLHALMDRIYKHVQNLR